MPSAKAFALTLFSLLCLAARADLWVTGYYPGWEQSGMPASSIDFSALTHIIHFSVVPNSDASLNSSANGISAANSSSIITNAHAAARKVLLCVGGASSQAGFQGATTSANRSAFISNLVSLMSNRGYDGLDIDWEPLDPSDANQYTNFVIGLRIALNAINPRPVLT